MLLGRCWEEPLAPFEPYAEALRQADAAAALRPGAEDAAGARQRLFDAVDAALTGLAAGRPLLLVLDDLHWADRGTLLLPSFLLRSQRPARCSFWAPIATPSFGRDPPLAAALADLRRAARSTGGAARAGRGGRRRTRPPLLGDDAVAAAVHARTDGNAFFVEEVLRGLAREPGGARERAPGGRRAACAAGPRRQRAARRRRRPGPGMRRRDPWWAPRASSRRPPRGARRAPAGAAAAPGGDRAAVRVRPRACARGGVDELNVLRRARLHRQAAEALTARGEDAHLEEIATHLFEAAGTADARLAADTLTRAGPMVLARNENARRVADLATRPFQHLRLARQDRRQ